MLKKIAATGGALGIALCWPFAVGQLGERIYLDTLAQYENNWMQVSNESYQRSYLSALAVSRVDFKGDVKLALEENGLPTSYRVQHDIKHGFMDIQSSSQLLVDQSVQALVWQYWGENNAPFVLDATTAITRATNANLTVNPLQYDDGEGNKVVSAPLVVNADVDADKNMQLSYSLPSLEVVSHFTEKMELINADGKANGRFEQGFWIGDQLVSLEKATMEDTQSTDKVELEALTASMQNTMQGTAETGFRLTNVNQLELKRLQLLELGEYQDFEWQFEFADLDYPALATIGQMADSFDGDLTPEQNQQVIEALDILVEKGLSLRLNKLDVVSPHGTFSNKIVFTLAPGIQQASQKIDQLPKNLTGDIDILVPIKFAQQLPVLEQRLKMLELGGVIEMTADHYQLSMKIEDEKVILSSGDQLPLSMLMMLVM